MDSSGQPGIPDGGNDETDETGPFLPRVVGQPLQRSPQVRRLKLVRARLADQVRRQ